MSKITMFLKRKSVGKNSDNNIYLSRQVQEKKTNPTFLGGREG